MNVFGSALKAAFAIAAGLCFAAKPAAAMSYSAVDFDDGKCKPSCASVIVASGSIAAAEVENLVSFIKSAPKDRRFAKVMLVHSPGGHSYGGIKLGAYLRQNGVTVIVARANGEAITRNSGITNGMCGSACVFVLAGGTKRIVPPGSKVAVHGARLIQTQVHDRIAGTVEDITLDRVALTGAFASYYKHMGISPDLARLAESIPHSEFRVLSQAEMTKFRLAQSRF